jgi:hypothetical protein
MIFESSIHDSLTNNCWRKSWGEGQSCNGNDTLPPRVSRRECAACFTVNCGNDNVAFAHVLPAQHSTNRSISPILNAHSWLSIEFMHNMMHVAVQCISERWCNGRHGHSSWTTENDDFFLQYGAVLMGITYVQLIRGATRPSATKILARKQRPEICWKLLSTLQRIQLNKYY